MSAPTPRSLMDPTWLAERQVADLEQLSRPLWAEDECAA